MLQKIYRVFIPVAILLFIATNSFTQTACFGGRGLLRVFSAETIQTGAIFFNTYYTAFVRSTDRDGFGSVQNFNIGFTYGISNSLELTAQVIPYQDDQSNNLVSPGNTQIGLKWNLPFLSPSFIMGIRSFINVPTARNPNPVFEPYSSPYVALGVMGLITVDLSRTFSNYPVKFHINIGFLDHNIESIFSKDLTDQLLIGFGFKIPIRPFILYSEYTGEIFINNDKVKFRDNSMRLTQGLKFKGPFRTIVDLGFDIGLSRNRDSYPTNLVHNYADWKIIAGLNYHFKTSRVYGNAPIGSKIDRKKEEKLLEEIKKKREKANKEIEKTDDKLKKKTVKKNNLLPDKFLNLDYVSKLN